MILFKRRAEPDESSKETVENIEDPILSAFIRNEEIGRDTALNIPDLAACINKIADTVASVPVKLYKKEENRIVEVKDYRTQLLNKETGDTLDAVQFKRALIKDYYLGRGGFAYVNWKGRKIKSIHYVDERNISFEIGADVIFKDYNILVQGKKYMPFQFVRLLRSSRTGISSDSIIKENIKLLDVAYNSLKFEQNLVATGGNKKGFIKSPKTLTREAIETLKRAWKKLYSNNDENVVILNNGLEFQEASNTSVELQLNENKQTNGNNICKICGVPPSILNGGSTEQDEKNFIKYEVNNVFSAFESALNRAMLLESEKDTLFFAFDTSELTKNDIDKRYAAYSTGIEKGFLQPDEVRYKENLPPLELDFIKLGLQDVLYDPKTKTIYTPNTNASAKLNGDDEKVEN